MQDESEPLLGISWGSSNGDKVVPDLQAGRQSSAGQGPNSSHSNMATSDSDLAVLQELSGRPCDPRPGNRPDGRSRRLRRPDWRARRRRCHQQHHDRPPRALRVRVAAPHQCRPVDGAEPLPEWDGVDLTGRTILVRAYTPRDRVGEELRLARFHRAGGAASPAHNRACRTSVGPAAPLQLRWGRCAPRGIDNAAAFAEADVAAYYETIALRYAKTAEAMRGAFVALQADPGRSRSLWQRYAQGLGGPLVGDLVGEQQ